MNSRKNIGRLTGLLYIGFGLISAFSLAYLPTVFYVPGNVAATAQNILAHEFLFRIGIAAGLIGAAGFLFVPFTLYGLLKTVDSKLATLMVTLFAVSVPISFLNELNHIAALKLASGTNLLSAFTRPELDALATVFLNLWGHGNLLAQIFWGLWLFPLALLILKSGFLPRIMGVLLIIAGFGYLVSSVGQLLLPNSAHIVSMISAATGAAGELPVSLWLLVNGGTDIPAVADPV
jgi:Domain of unknown function (DUF4386)